MKSQEIVDYKLTPALRECEQHRYRLHSAWQEAITFEPLQSGSIAELSDDQVRTLDQLPFRFAKLQDAVGTRLLPAMLQLVQEWEDNEPFLDKLNRAEKPGMMPSVEQWQLLWELRNQTAHEYPDQPERVKANLSQLLEQVPVLEDIYRRMSNWVLGFKGC
ncbi:MAG: hypothetical protein U9P07_00960 [Pseudomonadota bacterium]|nr:hypothetical protein [Pseudomonadota bacterium]